MTKYTREQAKAIREHHERLFPGLASQCRMSVRQMQEGLDSFRESLHRHCDIMEMSDAQRAAKLASCGL